MVELHGEGGGVEQDRDEDRVLAEGRGGEAPQPVLQWMLWNVSSNWLGVEGVLYAVTLKHTFVYIK